MKKQLVFVIGALVVFMVACGQSSPSSPTPATPTASPTPTPLPLTVVPNACLEIVGQAFFYDSYEGNETVHENIWRQLLPNGAKIIYLGTKIQDRMFVSYGDEEGWVLSNYVRECR